MTVQNLKQGLVTQGKVESFPTLLKVQEAEVSRALPEHLRANIGRYTRLALTQFRQNPKLAECDPLSVFAAVILASQLGLELGVMGQGYLVPYGNQAQFVPGWRGIVDLIHRSSRAMVFTGCVYEGDSFDFQLGDSPYVRHRPVGEDDDDKIIAAYAVGRIKDLDYPIIECWPIVKIKKHLDRYNKVGRRHYAFENMEMYARKVVLLQVAKYLPASVEVNTLSVLDHQYQSGVPQDLTINAAAEGLVFPGVIPTTAATEQTPTANTQSPGATTTSTQRPPTATASANPPPKTTVAPPPPPAKPTAPQPPPPATEVVQQPSPKEEPAPLSVSAPAVLLPQEEAAVPAAAVSSDDGNEPGEIIRHVQFPKRYARLPGEPEPSEELKQQAKQEAAALGQEIELITPHWLKGTAFNDLTEKALSCLIQALQNVPRKKRD